MGKGGGGGAPTQTTSTNYQTNIPEYARPYVETMLGATQQQLFQGNPTGDGGFNITGFQPYKAYGGTYDAQGNQTAYDPSKAVAGFSPLQQQAQQGIANLQVPGQFNQAMQGTANAGMGGFGVANQATTGGFQNEVGGYMNPYLNMALQPALQEAQRQYGITGAQQQSAATQAGAFGGSREAIMAAENERNKNTAMNQIIGQGYNQAFQGAQQQYNQNLQNQLSGYGLAGQQAGQLAGIAGQELSAQQGIYGVQNQMGAQQQAQQQQIINQSMQDYANAQQYPLMQLGTMSNMIRGLPMQAQTTQQYAAAPNSITQGIGAAGAAASLYNATKAEGGVIKSMASGGIASIPRYDVGGEVYADLQKMSPDQLKDQIENSSSPAVKEMARKLLAMEQPTRAASGGILRYKEPSKDNNEGVTTDMTARGEGSMMDRINAVGSGIPIETPTRTAGPKTAPDYTVDNPAGGILGNATSGIKAGAPNPTSVAPITVKPSGLLTPEMAATQNRLLAQQADIEKQSQRSIADIAQEKANYLGPNTGRVEARKNAMEEKANLADEARRQKDLRLAEFFASWGSTPGSTLVAGMTALKKSIPDMINDRKEAKKLEKESNKLIYDLDEADRMEKAGFYKEAAAEKNELAKRAEDLNKSIVAAQHAQMQAAATVKSSENQLEGTKYHANKQAESAGKTAGVADKRFLEQQRFHLQTAERDTAKAKAALEAEIAKEAKDTKYTMDLAIANANSRGGDPKAKAAAQVRVAETQAGWKARRDQASSDNQLARDQLTEINNALGIKGGKTSGATDTNTPPPAAAPTVTIGDKTYSKPAGMSDSQWEAYKKSQGVK